MQNEFKNSIFTEINIAKGITALLVVLGHSISQTGVSSDLFLWTSSIIYSFHMPLFFFLSGFLAIKVIKISGIKDKLSYTKDRFLRLMVPYFIVGFLYLPFKILLASYARFPYDISQIWKIFLGINPDGALWFLYVLFFISILSCFVLNKKNLNVVLFLAIIISGATFIFTINSGTLNNILFNFLFFILGIFVRKHYERIKKLIYSVPVFLGFLIVFVIANYFKYYYLPYLQLITAVSGIIVMLIISIFIADSRNIIGRFCNFLGDYCMDIYIISEPSKVFAKIVFWNVLGLNYILSTLIIFLVGTFLPIVISKIFVRRFRITRMVILGSKN